MSKHKLYLEVTKDKYELPIAVAETVEELAKLRRISPKTIYSAMYKYRLGELKTCRYRMIELESEDEG